MRTTFGRMSLGIAVLVVTAIVVSCATLTRAPSEVAGARLFTFPADWGTVPAKTVTLFYPGQASWEFLTSKDHPGSSGLEAVGCVTCHTGQEKTLDSESIYLQFRWATATPHAMHTLWRYDGKQWVVWGGPKPDATKKGIPPSYEDRLAVLWDDPDNVPAFDGSQATFSRVGCWMTCHTSMRAMPRDVPKSALEPHPYWGREGRKVGDIRKYLLISRTARDEAGAWDKVKPAAELNRLKAAGKFLDLWQWRAARSNAVGYTSDDWVLEYRNGDAGRAPFFRRPKPEFMYDEKVVGFRAIPEAEFLPRMGQAALIEGKTAVPFDSKATFAVGDLLPQYILREPQGSGADVQASGRYADGYWVVELRRKLNTGNPDDRVLRPGKAYPVGFSIFDDTVSNRRHYVTLPLTVGLGVDGDVKAVKVGR